MVDKRKAVDSGLVGDECDLEYSDWYARIWRVVRSIEMFGRWSCGIRADRIRSWSSGGGSEEGTASVMMILEEVYGQ